MTIETCTKFYEMAKEKNDKDGMAYWENKIALHKLFIADREEKQKANINKIKEMSKNLEEKPKK